MKSKPVSHKNTNTFKFQTFSECLASINIDIIHRVRDVNEIPDEADTFFFETLEKWMELNCTEDFDSLCKELGYEIQTLPQIIHKQKEIVQILNNHIQNPEGLSLNAALELIIALARDLQVDFYPYFKTLFSSIIQLLATKNTELLENVFMCLSYLFKFLWRYMVKDIENIYRLYLPLLLDQKEYIRNFATESIAFLMRKVRDKESFFVFVFQDLDKHPEGTDGIAQLLFQTMKGIEKGFHSCTSCVFPVVLKCLGKGLDQQEDLPWETIENVAKQLILLMAAHTKQHQSTIIWNLMFDSITKLIEQVSSQKAEGKDLLYQHLSKLLSLFEIFIEFHRGKLISLPDDVAKILLNVLRCDDDLLDSCILHNIQCIASLFLNCYPKINKDIIKEIINLVYEGRFSQNFVFTFTRKMFSHPHFERNFLPLLLKYCEPTMQLMEQNSDNAVLGILAEYACKKVPTFNSGQDVNILRMETTMNTFRNCDLEIEIDKWFLNHLKVSSEDEVLQRLPAIWSSLICLPFASIIGNKDAIVAVQKISQTLSSIMIENNTEKSDKEAVSFVLCYALITLIQLQAGNIIYSVFSTELLVKLVTQHPDLTNILLLSDIFLTYAIMCKKQSILSSEKFAEIISLLQVNLMSPFHKVRLLTLRIFSNLSLLNIIDETPLFNICLSAECIPATVSDVREKLQLLHKLNYEHIHQVLNYQHYEQISIRYLIGMLYINFKLLWPSVRELIASHAFSLGNKFWDVYLLHLTSVYELIEEKASSEEFSTDLFRADDDITNLFYQMLSSSYHEETADHINHRILLWKTMELFSEEAEPRNRSLVTLLFQFMSKEFYVSSSLSEKWQYKSQQKMDISNVEEGNKCRINGRKKKKRREKSSVRKSNNRLLVSLKSHLTVFSKFKNPKAFYQQEELHKLYSTLLSFRDADVQKLAFDCLMRYDSKNIKPYIENFYRLLDNKTFKAEIVLFNLDSENGVILEQHRPDVLSLLMRILYGKMLCKTGNNTSGRNQAQSRRDLVLRFLAGCSENEIQVFLDIAFAHFKKIIQVDVGIMIREAKKIEDLSSINLHVYNSALNTLGTVFNHLGNLVPGLLPQLLKILLVIATTATSFLEKENTIYNHNSSFLKSMRTTSIKRLTEFFSWYGTYPFSTEEIDAIFDAVIWHLLPRLEKESLHHCSPLLCLFSAWSENPRFFPLFVKYYPADPNLSPLPHIISLYTSNAKQSVIELITTILLKLLSNDIDEEAQNLPRIKVNDCLVIPEFESADLEGSPSYGALILLPYIQHILERLKSSFKETAKSYKKPPTIKELKILSKISSHVTNVDRITELVEILILTLSTTKKRNQDTETEILEIILKFIKQVHLPKDFLRSLAPFFSSFFHQKSRSLLCCIVSAIADVEASFEEFSVVISKLNAWNPKQLEEPDYLARLDGYKMATQILNDIENKDINNLLTIVYNCIFFVKTSDDISLRDSASYFLQKLGVKLVEKKDTNKILFRTITKQVLLKEIKLELKNKSEVVRHEFIKILASFLCDDHFLTSLKELSQLCNEDQEMDFWENIKHIQIHRRTRAMTRFIQNLKSGKYTFHSNTLTSFIMPIAMSFLYDSTYSKHNHLIDAAVDIIGIISYYLPWHRYVTTFQYYLGLLFRKPDYHKISVKIIVAILDGFHFDLSKSKGLQANASTVDLQINEHQTDLNNEDDISDDKDIDKTLFEKEMLEEEMSTKIHSVVAKNLLPKLHTCLSETLKQDEHKLATRSSKEDEILVRLPIALAMVKLLQNLPHGMLEENIPGIFLKLCQLLKSHGESVRQTARETLVKIMKSLGPKYLWYLVKEMKAILKRGYQLHVLAYTVYAVLTNLQDQLGVGDLDNCLDTIVQICNDDLFGEIAEEKEVEKIVKKVKEAGATKTYVIYQILGKYISDGVLKNLIIPLTEILANTHNHKTVTKVQECLRHIILGLTENKDISIETLLIFIHATVKESIFYCSNKRKETPKVKKYQKPDSYLISKEPPRGVVNVRKSVKTNSHVLVEFGLQLFNSCLKKEKLSSDNQHHLEMLDPLVTILNDCLHSSFAKVTSSSLRCFVWILTFPLPSLRELVTDIATNLFILLNKYAGIGMAQGDNFEIVVVCFKSLTAMLRNVDYYLFTDDQLRVLLSYIEQDIFDHTRQATAFNLLRAILSRRLVIPEIYPIAEKVAEMSITDKEEHTRMQCRQVYMQYLLSYVSKQKDMAKALSFYVTQLEYEHEYGRASSLEMLNTIFNTFDQKDLKLYSGLFLIPLSARLVNDESPQCRNLSALAIKNFLSKIDEEVRTSLFSIVVTWLKNRKLAHRRLGAQICGFFAEVEKGRFEIRLSQILDRFQEELDPAKYTNMEEAPTGKSSDHILFHVLNALSKIISVCPYLRSEKFSNEFNGVLENVRTHMLHPHIWVQLAATQLFGLLFSLYPINEIVTSAIENKHNSKQYLLYETRIKLKQLSNDFCTQLSNPNLIESLAEQILKNLIYLSKVYYQLCKFVSEDVKEFSCQLMLNQLIKSICREANIEVVKNPKVKLKRTCAFKYIAAMALEMDKDMLTEKLLSFLTPLCREVTDKSPNTDSVLRTLAQEVLDLLSKTVGIEAFTETLSNVQSFLTHRRIKRKQENAAEALTNPQKYARKKIKKQQNKKIALKRKMIKPGRNIKKLKLADSVTTL